MAKQLSPQEMRELAKELEEFELDPIELRYLGPLLKYMTRDKLANVKEIVINKPGQIGFEKLGGKWEFIDAPELTEEQLNDGARVLANRFGLVFSPNTPVLGCKMAQGHRVQIIAGRNSRSGFSLAIRIQRKEIFELSDFKLSAAHQQEIKDAVKNQKTILISGGTSSGKTSFMNVALRFIPEHERLVTLEDVPELEVPHTNHLALLFGSSGDEEVQPRNITTILNATLRMRPDRILMGEIRKENAFTFCSAINTGHEGSMERAIQVQGH